MSLIIGNTNKTPSEPQKTNSFTIDSSDQNFVKDVIERSHSTLIIVDFWAPWCGPCKQLAPILEKVISLYAPQVQLVKINIDTDPMIAGQLQVQSIPAVIAFFQGRPVNGFMGALPESQVQKFIDQILGDHPQLNQHKDIEETAKLALDNKDFEKAQILFQEILTNKPTSTIALTGLARCALQEKNIDSAESYLEKIAIDDKNHIDVIQLKSTIELIKEYPDLPTIDQAELLYKNDPEKFENIKSLSIVLFQYDQIEKAFETLFHFFENTNHQEDKNEARKLIVKLFETLDSQNPLLLQYRKRLSRLLFS